MSGLDAWLLEDEQGPQVSVEHAEELAQVKAEKDAEERARRKAELVEKLVVPEQFASFFSPFEIEDLQDRFIDFDEDLSGTISVAELSKVFAALGEDIETDVLERLVEQVDENNSGALEWEEFVAMFADFKSAHSRMAKFMNVLGTLVKTPCVALKQEARRRKLDVFYSLIEVRAADSWNPQQFVMEVGVSGAFHEVVGEKTTTVVEARYFDGIGRTTRAAKFKAATMAMISLRENAPGAEYTPGTIPDIWKEWVKDNLCAGVASTKVLRKLRKKGFYPYKNHDVMDYVRAFNLLVELTSQDEEHDNNRVPSSAQLDATAALSKPQTPASRGTTSHSTSSLAAFDGGNAQALVHSDGSRMRFPADGRYSSIEDMPLPFVVWVKRCTAMYIDGPILIDILKREPFRFPAHLNEFVASEIAKRVFVHGDSLPLGGRKYDIFECTKTDDAGHVANFVAAGQDLKKTTKISGKEWYPIHYAAAQGALESVKVLIDKESEAVEQRDEVNKGIMHHAARSGNLKFVQYLTEKLSLDMIQIDNYGNLCTHIAADAGQPEILRWLLG